MTLYLILLLHIPGIDLYSKSTVLWHKGRSANFTESFTFEFNM